MAFEIVEKLSGIGMPRGLAEGEVTLNYGGEMRANAVDLALVGIRDRAVVLVDTLTRRVALRAAREDDADLAVVAVRPASKGDRGEDAGGRRLINVRHAIRRCELETKAVSGRYDAIVKADELVYIQLRINEGGTDKTEKSRVGGTGAARTSPTLKKAASKAV